MTAHHRSTPSIEQLFREHHQDLVARLVRRLAIPEDLAEDAAARAWERLLIRRPTGHVEGWLYTVAKHEAFDLMAQCRREIPVASTSRNEGRDLASVLEARRSLRLIAQLKPQQREVLCLRAQGHSYDSICRVTGRSYTWVNRHLTEGRRELRERIEAG